MKTIAISCDHAGFDLKEYIKKELQAKGYEVIDFGPQTAERIDYPDAIHPLAKAIDKGEIERGIIMCGSGNGVAMTANKYPNVRAGLAWEPEQAELTRQHNDANILSLPARFLTEEQAMECVDKFLTTEFEGGRHETRKEDCHFMRRVVALVCLCSVGLNTLAQQDSLQNRYANTITAKDLRARLEIIASDDFEGRETGQEGQKKAAKYIEERFQEFGYKPIPALGGYQQEFKLQLTYPDTVKLIVGKDTVKFLKDMYYFPGFGDMLLKAEDLLYLGYGIDDEKYSDYEGQQVEGKVLLISGGEPTTKKGVSHLTENNEKSEWTVEWTKKIELARAKNAKALLVIDDNFSTSVTQFGRYIKRPNLELGDEPTEKDGIPLIYISAKMANRIMKGAGVKGGIRNWKRPLIEKEFLLVRS